MSLALLIAATLMLRSFHSLSVADNGFQATDVTAVRLRVPHSLKPEDHRRDALYRSLREAVSKDPRVIATSWVNHLPMSGISMATLASPASGVSDPLRLEFRGVGPEYFKALGIPLLEGVDFAPHSEGESVAEVILSASAARRFWPERNAIGQLITLDWGEDTVRRVIGIVGDVKHHSISSETQPTAYLPYALVPRSSLTLVVKSTSAQASAVDIGMLARETDSAFVIEETNNLADLVSGTIAAARSRAVMTTALALTALLLATGGIFSVVTYSVSQRRHDFSVRQALGARPKQLVATTVSDGLRKATLGIFFGLLTAFLMTRALAGFLYGVSSHDPWSWLGMTLLMAGIVATATYLPARRAVKSDPARDLS